MRASLLCVVQDGTVPADGTLARVAAPTPIEWPAGDSGTIGIVVQGADGKPYDLAGCALTLVCRQHVADPVPAFAIAATIDSPPGAGGGGAGSGFSGTIDGGNAGGDAPAISSSGTVAVQASDSSALEPGQLCWYDVRLSAPGGQVQHVLPLSKWIPTATIARAGEPI